jgi:hypothetical protein
VITFDPANVDAPGTAMEFDYGDLSLGALADVESNQRRTEARFAFNLELVYTHDFWRRDGHHIGERRHRRCAPSGIHVQRFAEMRRIERMRRIDGLGPFSWTPGN